MNIVFTFIITLVIIDDTNVYGDPGCHVDDIGSTNDDADNDFVHHVIALSVVASFALTPFRQQSLSLSIRWTTISFHGASTPTLAVHLPRTDTEDGCKKK